MTYFSQIVTINSVVVAAKMCVTQFGKQLPEALSLSLLVKFFQ